METISVGTGLTVLGVAFAGWAWVVAWGIGIMRKELADVKMQLQSVAVGQNLHVNQTERRLTMLETEFAYIKAAFFRETAAERSKA
jgi:hypothetical protein